LKKLCEQIIKLKKFEESLTHEHAFDLVLNAMGSKLLELKDPVASEKRGGFIVDVLKLEAFMALNHPPFDSVRGISLRNKVRKVYGDKIVISMEKLL